MYGESHNMNSDDGDVVNKTQNFEAVLQYQFDFGLRPSIGYSYSKALDVAGYKDSDRLNYIEIGTWYYFNKMPSCCRQRETPLDVKLCSKYWVSA